MLYTCRPPQTPSRDEARGSFSSDQRGRDGGHDLPDPAPGDEPAQHEEPNGGELSRNKEEGSLHRGDENQNPRDQVFSGEGQQ